jgi:hypothetical protein
VKAFIKKLIFGSKPLKEFFDIRVHEEEIKEKVFLRSTNGIFDISTRHSIVCQTPYCIAVWLDAATEVFIETHATIDIIDRGKIKATVSLVKKQILKENNTVIIVFEVLKADCHQLSLLRQYLIFRVLNRGKKNSFSTMRINAALFSYPRKVILTSFQNGADYHIFPMDFRGHSSESNMYVLGLRTTNIAVEKMIANKKIVVVDTGTLSTDVIYSLGKYHSQDLPPMHSLPFEVEYSKLFNYPVPKLFTTYYEVEIFQSHKLGSHMLILGRVLNTKKGLVERIDLYHLHLFEILNSAYKV